MGDERVLHRDRRDDRAEEYERGRRQPTTNEFGL